MISSPRLIVVVPARRASTRLPDKLLLAESGRPLLVHTLQQCAKAKLPDLVVAAVDDSALHEVSLAAGFHSVMTSPELPSGTDRVWAAAQEYPSAEFIVNVQGDEPLFNPEDLKLLISEIKKYPKEIITGYCEINDEKDYRNLNVPKVVIRPDGRLLYASRAPIPSNKSNKFEKGFRQVCVYAFPSKVLKIFSERKSKTELEKIEDIEYLRFLELGIDIKTLKMSQMSLAVDTPEDVIEVKEIIKKKNL